MIALAPCSAAFSSAVPALRLQRVVARLRERATDKDIAEGPSRERLRQIAAAARGKARPIPKRMRFAGRCVWPRAASRMATRKPYPFCSMSSIGFGLVATRATSTTRSCSATWPSGRWTGHCESARKWRRKGLKTFDPRLEMRPAGSVDPQVRCLPSSIRGGLQVARKWRRKSLERLESRPEMAPRLACRMTGPRPSNTVTPAHAGSRRRSRLNLQHPSSLAGPPSRA